jgi:hypothetical protein
MVCSIILPNAKERRMGVVWAILAQRMGVRSRR